MGQETGGALTHLIFLAQVLNEHNIDNTLLFFEDGTVAKAAKAVGLKYKIINQKNTQEWINYLNKEKFDFVQTHGPRSNFLVSLQRKKIHAPQIITVHSDPKLDFLGSGLKGKIASKLNVWSLKRASGLFVVSSEIKKQLIGLGIKSDTIHQINNAIWFSPTVPKKKPHDFMQVIIVARLHPVKAHERLLQALAKINLSQIHLHIVGDGSLRESLENLVNEKKLQSQVHFYGALKRNEIDQLYPKMDLALIVSRSEGFPLVFLEAANSAVPVLMTDLSASKLLIPDSKYGIVVENSLEGIQAGLKKAFEMGPLKLEEIGKNSRRYAMAHFGADNFFQQLNQGYESFSKKNKI